MEKININYKKNRSKRKIIIMGIISLFIAFIIAVSIAIYVGLKLTTPDREKVDGTPKKYNLVYENISFKSNYDNVVLKGWWIPSQENTIVKNTDKTVIFAHGYGNTRTLNKIKVMDLAERLVKEGYNVLTFDFRGSGESEGKFVSIGGMEKYDLLSAINFAKNNKNSKSINLIGWSMGASTSILAGVESKDVKSIIADSPFGNLNNYLKENLPFWSHLPNTFFTKTILNTLPIIRKFDIKKVDPIKAVSNLKDKHLLLIHSKDDKAIPYSNSKLIYNAIKNKENADIWLTKKAEHIKSYTLYKSEYERRVLNFLKKYN